MNTEKLLISPQQAAERLSISRGHVYTLLARGEIESIRIGRARRIPIEALEVFVARERAAALDEEEAEVGS